MATIVATGASIALIPFPDPNRLDATGNYSNPNSSMRIRVPMIETMIDPRHPSRLEKKANILKLPCGSHPICRLCQKIEALTLQSPLPFAGEGTARSKPCAWLGPKEDAAYWFICRISSDSTCTSSEAISAWTDSVSGGAGSSSEPQPSVRVTARQRTEGSRTTRGEHFIDIRFRK